MTALSDLLTDAKNGGRNIDHWVSQAAENGHDIDRATVYSALAGKHAKSPRDTTLKALAFVFGLDVRDLREAVKRPRGELGAWTPVDEASQLDQDQRDALDLLIKAIVRGGVEHADGSATNKVPETGPGQQPVLRQLRENEVDLAARPDRRTKRRSRPED